MSHLPLSRMNGLNKIESAIFKLWKEDHVTTDVLGKTSLCRCSFNFYCFKCLIWISFICAYSMFYVDK